MLICRKSRPGVVQLLDALGRQEVAVGDEPGHHAVTTDAADQVVEVGMEHRLAAAEGHHRGAELGQLVDAPDHRVGRHRRRDLVVLVAVAAVDVAAADRDDLDEQRVGGVGQAAHELAQPTHLAADVGGHYSRS